MAERLFVGGNGSVCAVDARTLEPLWELELKTGWFKVGSQFVSLREEEDALYALAYGRVHRICKESGALLEVGSELRGLRQGPGVFSGSLGATDAAATDAAACTGGSDGDDGGDGGD